MTVYDKVNSKMKHYLRKHEKAWDTSNPDSEVCIAIHASQTPTPNSPITYLGNFNFLNDRELMILCLVVVYTHSPEILVYVGNEVMKKLEKRYEQKPGNLEILTFIGLIAEKQKFYKETGKIRNFRKHRNQLLFTVISPRRILGILGNSKEVEHILQLRLGIRKLRRKDPKKSQRKRGYSDHGAARRFDDNLPELWKEAYPDTFQCFLDTISKEYSLWLEDYLDEPEILIDLLLGELSDQIRQTNQARMF